MFSKSAHIYDAIYTGRKDYAAEAGQVHRLIQQHCTARGITLLDVACGTGLHLEHLQKHYQAAGLDLDEGLLEVARGRCPGIPFYHADMLDFELGQTFDAITCLFSAIGYVKIVPRLRQALRTLARHLAPGGVLVVEPWFEPDTFLDNTVHMVVVDQPDLKIARMNVSRVKGRISSFDFHYMVGTPAGVQSFVERHELGLFTRREYLDAFTRAGLKVVYDEQGLTGRGLFIGLKPA